MKIVVLDGYTLNPGDQTWEAFSELGDFTCYDRTSPEDTIKRIGDAEAVITNKTYISAETIKRCPTIKYIGALSTGINVIDIDAATERGIPVCNIPDYSTSAVAQLVFAHLLNICHHVDKHSDAVYNGDWTKNSDFCFWNFPLIELAGKTLGIIGFGRTGQATAKIAQAFGMNVITYTRNPNKKLENRNFKYTGFDQVLKNSDVISLHCPLSESTQGLINKNTIDKMKDGVIIINTSRGGVIVEKDLANALKNGKIYAAGLDVTSVEPIQEDNPLLKVNNCFITPHIAWAPLETRIRLMNIAVENLKAFIAGNTLNQVN